MKLLHRSIGPYGPYDVYLEQATLFVKLNEKWLILGSIPPPKPGHPAHKFNLETGKALWITGLILPTEMESWLDICVVSGELFKDRSEQVAIRPQLPIHQVN